MIPAILAGIGSKLAADGLGILSSFISKKGEEGLKWVAEKTGLDLTKYDTMSEADKLSLRQFEMEHEEEMTRLNIEGKKLELEVFKAEVDDRKNARDNEVEITKLPGASWLQKNIKHLLAMAVLAITCYMYWYVIATEQIPDERTERIVMYVLGALTSASTMILAYYFGSSSNSQVQQETIQQLARKDK